MDLLQTIHIFTKPGSVLPLVVKMSSCVKSNVNFADVPVFTPNPPSVLFTLTVLLAQSAQKFKGTVASILKSSHFLLIPHEDGNLGGFIIHETFLELHIKTMSEVDGEQTLKGLHADRQVFLKSLEAVRSQIDVILTNVFQGEI